MTSDAAITRRSLLRRVLALAGAAALLPRIAQAIQPAAVHYTERSPDPGKTCSQCLSFIPPAQPGEAGGCYILRGPISPQGHCDEWSARKP